jgi:hypothetical protein
LVVHRWCLGTVAILSNTPPLPFSLSSNPDGKPVALYVYPRDDTCSYLQ